ncbi:MAG: hypothetical protein IKX70_03985 [Treponema sp.]|nr:hypothetical protein [Treponema sp.]MBR5032804.1 hypothetical protein [Treponema sp.]
MAATSENFWRMPEKKSEDLHSKPQDFYRKKIAQPVADIQFSREQQMFFYMIACLY